MDRSFDFPSVMIQAASDQATWRRILLASLLISGAKDLPMNELFLKIKRRNLGRVRIYPNSGQVY
jgi:hypothetical protein